MKESIALSLANLNFYLDSWTAPDSGTHGYIIHHHRDYVVNIAPATWTQGIRILGHLKLFKKTNDQYWLQKVISGCDYLYKSYIWDEHIYTDSTTPLTLINNAWPTLSLLESCLVLGDLDPKRCQKYLRVAKDHVLGRILPYHWDQDVKTFFFCPETFPANRVHTYNQNAIVAPLFYILSEIEDDKKYIEEYAKPTIDHLVEGQIVDDPESLLYGGWGYNDGRSSHLFYYLYTALNMRGLLDVYEHSYTTRYLESAKLAGIHLKKMLSETTGLFKHRYVKKGKKVLEFTYPTMIAASGLGLLQIKRLEKWGIYLDIEENVYTLLKFQNSHGGFQNFIGVTDIWAPSLFPCEPEKVKWRDVISVPFWNVFAFELFAYLLEDGQNIPPPNATFPLILKTDDGIIVEEEQDYVRLSKNGTTQAFFQKKSDTMLYSTLPCRGAPFGTFNPAQDVTIRKLREILKKAGLLGCTALLIETIILIYLLLT